MEASMTSGKTVYQLSEFDSFTIDSKYEFIDLIGQGAFGLVAKARDLETGEEVAIKRISRVFSNSLDAKRTLRELKILNVMRHENIVCLRDVMVILPEERGTYQDVYIVTDLMETDLNQIIRSEQVLSVDHYKYFIYQIFKGLKFLHSANVIHRDLKPSNILVNAASTLKICDFGLARVDDLELDDTGNGQFTHYVVTRYYRSPEVIADRSSYGKAVDMWSAGCILAELVLRKVLLPGQDQFDQLSQILYLVGKPSPDEVLRIKNAHLRSLIANFSDVQHADFSVLFSAATPEGVDLLERILVWDADFRLTAEEALEHAFVQEYREDVEEETCAPGHFDTFDFEHDPDLSCDDLRMLIYNEMLLYHQDLAYHLGML